MEEGVTLRGELRESVDGGRDGMAGREGWETMLGRGWYGSVGCLGWGRRSRRGLGSWGGGSGHCYAEVEGRRGWSPGWGRWGAGSRRR